jgi:deoxyribonuclease V
MQINALHGWEVTPREAIEIQQKLIHNIQLAPLPPEIHLVAGVDVSYKIGSDRFYAGIVVLQLPALSLVEETVAVGETLFPYIPGLLSFREAPILLQAFQKLASQPDAIIVDGQGIAHPRGIGIASHLGLFLDCPSVGCAKSKLTGVYEANKLQTTAGSFIPLRTGDGTVIGAVVRTKQNTQPVFVSPGFKADLATSVALVLKCCQGYKLPEPTRQAHHLVNRARREDAAAEF